MAESVQSRVQMDLSLSQTNQELGDISIKMKKCES